MQEQQRGQENPMSDAQIMQHVLGTRRGWERGVGPIIGSSSSHESSTGQRMFSQAELEDVVASRMALEREKWQAEQAQMMAQMMTQMQTQFQSQIQSATAPLYDAIKKGGAFQPSQDENDETEED